MSFFFIFFFSSRRRHTRSLRDWSSDVCSSDLVHRYNGAEVNRLVLVNNSKRPLLLLAGEVVSGDRKSTRLNSSHVEISYAVFCLKKKKRNKDGAWRTVSSARSGPVAPLWAPTV